MKGPLSCVFFFFFFSYFQHIKYIDKINYWKIKNIDSCYFWLWYHECFCFLFCDFSVTQSCPTLSDPTDCSPPGSSIHGIFPGKNTGVGCQFLLQLCSLLLSVFSKVPTISVYKQEISQLKLKHSQTCRASLPAVTCFLFPLAFGVSRVGHAGLQQGSTNTVRDASTVTATCLWSPVSLAR